MIFKSFLSIFSKKEIPKLVYEEPKIKCSNTILLSGPSYGDKTFLGSFFLDVTASKDWMLNHSLSVFSSSKLEQQARLYLPKWCEFVTNKDADYVTLLDIHMRHVLVPYTYDFYLKGWLKCYCHQCSILHNKLLDNSSEVEKFGNNRSWTEEWLCPNGHILHNKNQELRLLIRRK